MIGNRLKRARDAAGMSLRDLEAAIQGQVSAQAIGKYERDEMMPGSTTAERRSSANDAGAADAMMPSLSRYSRRKAGGL